MRGETGLVAGLDGPRARCRSLESESERIEVRRGN